METIKLNINLTVNQLMEAVKQLSPKDKLKINDAIWSDDMEIPIEHQKIVMDRISKSKTNPERLLDWDEVSKNF
ncbi:addiction module protein [Flavobacterium qiangtangense]|uniref:Addiction module protein n=1 Tax=Flavobacterium qiangtangense TaxID=1442595 RepID=A0ABW1PRQ9_9FLAO